MNPYLHNFLPAFRLFLLGRYHPQQWRADSTAFALGVCVYILINATVSWFTVEPPLRFDPYAFEPIALNMASLLVAAFIVTRWHSQPDTLWGVAVPLLYASLWFEVLINLPLLDINIFQVNWWKHIELYRVCAAVWCFIITLRLLSRLYGSRLIRRIACAWLAALLFYIPSRFDSDTQLWQTDYSAKHQEADEEEKEYLDIERVLMEQHPLLQAALAALKPQRPGVMDMYFVGFAGDGGQDVFLKESLFTRNLFDRQYDTAGRSALLVNYDQFYFKSSASKFVDELATALDPDFKPTAPGTPPYPMATVASLEMTLAHIGRLIDKEEDMLFLSITSHGGDDHSIYVSLDELPLNMLTPEALAKALKESGIKWKIVVVSACYSGGLIDTLKDENTLIITSARADLTSFGCGDLSEMTYFGEAYFKEALLKNRNFIDAFSIATQKVSTWERDNFMPHYSQPQLYVGEKIKEKLKRYFGSPAAHAPGNDSPLKPN